MSAINLSPPAKAKRSARKKAKQNTPQETDELLAAFPLPRYFQIHFQYLHESNETIHQELAALKHYVSQLESRLDELLVLVTQQNRENNGNS